MKLSVIKLMVGCLAVATLKPAAVRAFESSPSEIDETMETNEGPPRAAYPDFHDELSADGDWFWTEQYGWVWRPTHMVSEWRPFTYGYWEYSNHGWLWNSNFSWGWVAFYYGDWVHLCPNGWVWVPSRIWSPAPVVWRYSGNYIGWAPYYGWSHCLPYYEAWSFIAWQYFSYNRAYLHYLSHRRDIYHRTYWPSHCRRKHHGRCNHGPDYQRAVKFTGRHIPKKNFKKPTPHRVIHSKKVGYDKPFRAHSAAFKKTVKPIQGNTTIHKFGPGKTPQTKPAQFKHHKPIRPRKIAVPKQKSIRKLPRNLPSTVNVKTRPSIPKPSRTIHKPKNAKPSRQKSSNSSIRRSAPTPRSSPMRRSTPTRRSSPAQRGSSRSGGRRQR